MMTEIWRRRILWRRYVHPHNHPHIQLKKSGISHTHIHTQSMQGFFGQNRDEFGQFARDRFICRLYSYMIIF